MKNTHAKLRWERPAAFQMDAADAEQFNWGPGDDAGNNMMGGS